MSNYPVLVENTLLGFSETAGELYIFLLDQFEGWTQPSNERKAFWAAVDYENKVGHTLDFILTNGPFEHMTETVKSKLSSFFAKRWQHNFMGN